MKNNNSTEQRQAIAATIARQLAGSYGAIAAMTGAKNFVAHEAGLSFKFPNRKRSLPNFCQITLGADDTYTVRFCRIGKRGLEVNELGTVEGVYCDMLTNLFETRTGLFLSL
jgi:hypothetical protein